MLLLNQKLWIEAAKLSFSEGDSNDGKGIN